MKVGVIGVGRRAYVLRIGRWFMLSASREESEVGGKSDVTVMLKLEW